MPRLPDKDGKRGFNINSDYCPKVLTFVPERSKILIVGGGKHEKAKYIKSY